MSIELPFDPFPLLSGSHKQTIIGSLINLHREPKSETRLISLPDGDKISIEVTTPENWNPNSLSVLMVHGLCGSHRSSCLVRMTKRLASQGIRCIRFNMRGCGTGKGHAKQIYHSGRSDDVWHVLQALKKEHPQSFFVLIGYSLGGNIVLKLAGELANETEGFIQQVIAVSPPVDLHDSVMRMSLRSNLFYEQYFLRLLKNNVRFRHKKFPELPKIEWPRGMKFYDFDELYTAPQCGFENALDYYKKCSSLPVVPDITLPCRILFSHDDPLISANSLDHLILPENVEIYKTKKGGHMGYLAIPKNERGFHWMDHVLEQWIFNSDE